MIVALLALAPRAAAAPQSPHQDPFERNPFERSEAPASVLSFGPAQVRNLNLEFEQDLNALGAFDGRQRVDRFSIKSSLERPKPWMAYGRLGPLNFQNELEPQRSQGMRFSLRRTGPKLTGRVYFGVHRTFD